MNTPSRQCDGKIAYATDREAMRAAEQMTAKRGENFNHYRCQNCADWHIGHTPFLPVENVMNNDNQNPPTTALVPQAPQVPATVADPRPLEVQKFELQQRAAKLFAMSGLFADIKGQSPEQSIAQAFVKISLGDSMGFTPAESMTGIDIIQGRVAIGASIRAARMQRAGYAWDILQLDDRGCRLRLYFKGQPLMQEEIDAHTGEVTKVPAIVAFMAEDASRAGVLSKDNYKKNPRNMFFARAITNAQRWFAPGILGADILDSDEARALEPTGEAKSSAAVRKASEQKAAALAEKYTKPAEAIEVSLDPPAAAEPEAPAPLPSHQEARPRSRSRNSNPSGQGVAGIFESASGATPAVPFDEEIE